MQIVGENWDNKIYTALISHPPPTHLDNNKQREYVLEVIINELGDSLRSYFHTILPRLVAVLPEASGDPVHLYVDWLSRYYLNMHYAISEGVDRMPVTWENETVSLSGGLRTERPHIFVTFQIGYPLLCPMHLMQMGVDNLRVMMHKQNIFAIDLIRGTVGDNSPLFLEDLNAILLLRHLKGGGGVVANIDVAYPGTRTQSISLCQGILDIPTGILELAVRTNAMVQGIALPESHTGIAPVMSEAIDASTQGIENVLSMISTFFDTIICQYPTQWFGWAAIHDRKPVC